MKKSFAIFFISSMLVSCASPRTNPLLGQKSDIALSRKELKSSLNKSKVLWSHRNEKKSLSEFIRVQNKIARTKSATPKDMTLLARAHLLWGDYFSDNESERCAAWESGSQWAEKALTFNPVFKSRVVHQKLPPIQALDTLATKDAEPLFWFATATEKWSHCKGVSTELQYKDRIKKMMDRVAQLDSSGHQGSIYRYYGVLYSQIPGFNSEDLALSKTHFEKAILSDPTNFTHRTQFAQYYAKKIDDEDLFRNQLEWVIQTIPNRHKEDYPEQILEQRRAQKILEGKTP